MKLNTPYPGSVQLFLMYTMEEKSKESERWGIALSGGGARGAYQYGVWQVLRETPFYQQISVLAGTSIGAINAVLFLHEKQTGDPLPRRFWEEADLSAIFSVFPPGKTDLSAEDYLRLGWDGLRHRGIRVDALKDWLRQHIDLRVLAEAGIDIAVNAWDIRSFREIVKTFPGSSGEEDFLEWVIGSASFPAFGPHVYRGYWLFDGGISNNLPIHLAFRTGAVDQVLAIDLATFMRYHPRQLWLERKYAQKIHFLRVPMRQPSPLAFSRPSLDRLIAQGRADAQAWWRNGASRPLY